MQGTVFLVPTKLPVRSPGVSISLKGGKIEALFSSSLNARSRSRVYTGMKILACLINNKNTQNYETICQDHWSRFMSASQLNTKLSIGKNSRTTWPCHPAPYIYAVYMGTSGLISILIGQKMQLTCCDYGNNMRKRYMWNEMF